MDGVPGNQLGNVGIIYPNALGVQFALSQANGNSQGGGAGSNVFSTVTLTQSGNLIYAEPGDSSVDIGQTIVGQNVQYISQMAGTTMINSPVVVNGNVAIPHQYTFSMNPENNTNLPTATINANVTVGGAGDVELGSSGTPLTAMNVYGEVVDITAGGFSASASSILLEGPHSYIGVDTLGGSNIYLNTTTGAVDVVSRVTGLLTSNVSVYSSNDFDVTSLERVSFLTSNISTVSRMTSVYSSNTYDNYAGFINLMSDGGANLGANPITYIGSQNGAQGKVSINAKSGFGGTAFGGVVDITAEGGRNPLLGLGGTVLVNAWSAGFGSFGGTTSRVSVNAANIGLSAGALDALPGLAGSMNIYGQGCVSIVTDALPPVFPQIPQSLYMYGANGIRLDTGLLYGGIQCLKPLYAQNIYPLADGSNPLIISGRTNPSASVQLKDIELMNMVLPNGRITGVSSINSLGLNKSRDISNLSTINGLPYPYITPSDSSNWSYYPQLSSLSTITAATGILSTLNVSSINGQPIGLPWYQVTPPLLSTAFNFGGNGLSNVSSLYTTILRTNRISDFSPSGASLSITNLSSVNGNKYVPTQEWSQQPADSSLDVAGFNVGNVGTVFANNLNLTNDFTMTNNDSVANFNNNALINVSSLNGYPVTSIVNGWVSTATTQLDMNNFSIVNTNSITADTLLASLVSMNSLSTASITCFGAVNLNSNALLTVSSVQATANNTISFGNAGLTNVSSLNGYPITSIVNGWVSTATTALNMAGNLIYGVTDVAATGNIFTLGEIGAAGPIASATASFQSIINLSSVNGVAYNPSGGGWNGNATTNLNMNFYDITTVQNMNANSIVCVGNVSAATMSLPGTITAGNFSTVPGSNGTTSIYWGSVITNYIGASNINVPALTGVTSINALPYYPYSSLPAQYFASVSGSAQYSFTTPGQYFFSAQPDGDTVTVYLNADGGTVPGRYMVTNRNTNNGGVMAIALQVLVNGVPTLVDNIPTSPGYSIRFDITTGRQGVMVYQSIVTQVPSYPSQYA